MKKFLIVICLLLFSICYAYYEENIIFDIKADGKILIMGDGKVYKVFDYEEPTTAVWVPPVDVVITNDRIINLDDNESADIERRLK